MSDRTAIEWSDTTWNPTTGCDQVSPGCDNCYALTLAKRLQAMGSPRYQNDGDPRTSGPGFGLTLHHDKLDEPLHWRKPRRVFVDSMSDLFHPDVPDQFILDVWTTMARAEQHQFQILTKRPQRMADLVNRICWRDVAYRTTSWVDPDMSEATAYLVEVEGEQPLDNVWLGTSIESDRYTFRARHLAETPAAIRFLSLEPLIGPLPSLDLMGIDWVIVGGESGPNHRPIEADWVRDIRDRCIDADVPFFMKQWGGRTPKAGGRELDGRTWDQYPDQLTTV